MDILDKLSLFIGEEISGTPAPTPGTTTTKVSTYVRPEQVLPAGPKKKKKKKAGISGTAALQNISSI